MLGLLRSGPGNLPTTDVSSLPGLTPRPGDFVLARNKNGFVGVARFVGLADGAITFQYLNGDQRCDVPLVEIDYMHRIMGSAG